MTIALVSKDTMDITAALTAWSAAIGLITNIVGLVGATLSAVWIGYRLYDYLKGRNRGS